MTRRQEVHCGFVQALLRGGGHPYTRADAVPRSDDLPVQSPGAIYPNSEDLRSADAVVALRTAFVSLQSRLATP